MTATRTAVLTFLALLAATGSAHAAAPWAAPATLGTPANVAAVVGLGFTPRGDGLLSWRLGSASFVAALRGDGVAGPPTRLPAELAAAQTPALGPPLPTPASAQRTIVVLRRLLPPAPRRAGSDLAPDRTRLSWALVGPGGVLGRVEPLTIARCLTCQVKLAVNWLGEAVAVWSEEGRGIRASWRPAGGRFGAPVTIFDGRSGQYPDRTAAIGSDGRTIIVDGGTVVRARTRTRNGRLGPIMRVGAGDGSVQVAAAISNGGRSVVVWGSQDGGEEANEPWVVRAARLSRGGRRFAATQTLDQGSAAARPEGRIALAFTPGGKATVAWSAAGAGDTFPVMAASARTGGRFGAAQRLAPSGAVGAVSVRADGGAVVAWSLLAGSQQPVQAFASVRPAGAAAFGSPEAIGDRERGLFAPLAAFDPVSRRPTVAWGARPRDPIAPDVDNAVVHVAARAAP